MMSGRGFRGVALALACLVSSSASAQTSVRARFATAATAAGPIGSFVTNDTFTGTAGTDLASHTGDVGATWTEHPKASAGSVVLTDANRARLATAGQNENYYSSGVPATACYTVSQDYEIKTVIAGHFYSLWARMDTIDLTGYFVMYDVPAGEWSMWRSVDGLANVEIGSFTQALTAATTVHVSFEVTHLSKVLYLDGVERIRSTDNVVTAKGRGGIGGFATSPAPTNTTGIHYDNFTVVDYGGACDLPSDVGTPTDGIHITPGSSIQTAVNANPDGTTFFLEAGVHRLQEVIPKPGNVFNGAGQGSTIIRGSNQLTSASFVDQGNGTWRLALTTTMTQSQEWNCMAAAPGCGYDQELFYDGVRLRRATTLGGVITGRWWYDETYHYVYVANTPTAHLLELSSARTAFGGTSDDVILRGMTIENYASIAQRGCVNSLTAGHWTFERVTVQNCHGAGIESGQGSILRDSRVLHNGQIGIKAAGTNVIFEYSEIAWNNEALYAPGFEAGGSKLSTCSACSVRYCYIHDNAGPGGWYDINNDNSFFLFNTVDDNYSPSDAEGGTGAQAPGLFVEISQSITIQHNLVRRNGFGYASNTYAFASCIVIAASGDADTTDISENVCEDNATGITLVQQDREHNADGSIQYGGNHKNLNAHVHHNTIAANVAIAQQTYWQAGASTDSNGAAVSNVFANGNTFDHNTYFTGGGSATWTWNNATMNFATWSALWTGETQQTYASYTHSASGANGAGPR